MPVEFAPTRIAIKVKGKIVFINAGDVITVSAEGNYLLLQPESRSYLLREPWRLMLMRFKKHKRKWNGAGTFGFLVTLKKHERCERCRRRIPRIELAHRL